MPAHPFLEIFEILFYAIPNRQFRFSNDSRIIVVNKTVVSPLWEYRVMRGLVPKLKAAT